VTSRTKDELTTQVTNLINDNTAQEITAADVRSVMTDFNDTIFRKGAIALEDLTGRILLEQGGYLLKES